MSSKGNRKKLRNGLTQKENAFKNKILEQITSGESMNGTKAALAVYDTTDPNTANQIALGNLQKPTIKEAVETALESQGLTPDKILQNIGRLASFEPIKVTADVILRANQDLLRLQDAYPSKKTVHTKLNLKGKMSDLSFEEAKLMHDKMNAEVGELVEDGK